MKSFIAVLAVLAVGCGPRIDFPVDPHFDYTVDPFRGLSTETPVSRTDMQRNADLAFSILEREGLTTRADAAELELVMVNRYSIKDQFDGLYVPESMTIYLNFCGTALLHELLHHYEHKYMGQDNPDHVGWNTRGWDKLQVEYGKGYTPTCSVYANNG